MTGQKEMAEGLKTIGWISRKEAAEMTGRTDGGNLDALFESHGVRFIAMSKGTNGEKQKRMYRREDMDKVPFVKNRQDKIVIPDPLDLSEMNSRIAVLEKFMNDLIG